MKKYIFVTPEGSIETPNGKPIENLQVIGFADGVNEVEALKNLLKENTWIWDSGFNVAEFFGYEINTDT